MPNPAGNEKNHVYYDETEIVARADGKADNGLLYGSKVSVEQVTLKVGFTLDDTIDGSSPPTGLPGGPDIFVAKGYGFIQPDQGGPDVLVVGGWGNAISGTDEMVVTTTGKPVIAANNTAVLHDEENFWYDNITGEGNNSPDSSSFKFGGGYIDGDDYNAAIVTYDEGNFVYDIA